MLIIGLAIYQQEKEGAKQEDIFPWQHAMCWQSNSTEK
jgi:hypothetical protein